MRKEYEDELETLRIKMQKAEKFAEALPIFAERILEYKFTGDEDWLDFGNCYKKIPLGWGIKRGYYRNGSSRYLLNYPKDAEYNLPLFNIYVNSYSLFDCNENFNLYESFKDVEIFFIDYMNSTFYITDENIFPFLEALNAWYNVAKDELLKLNKEKEIADLKKRLEKLEPQQATP